MRPDDYRPRRAARRFRLSERVAGLALVAVVGGCELPTDPPIVETRWILPADETRFGVAELLPGDVSLNADSSAFIVDFDPVLFSQTLGGICTACVAADGLTVPKPPFVGGFAADISFPPEVLSIAVIGGQVDVELYNGFNFDPIRPAAGAFGTLTIDVLDSFDDDVIGTLTIEGADQAFAAGATLMTTIDLQTTDVEGSLDVRVTLDSPTGDPVTVDSDLQLTVTASPANVTVGSVEIDVSSELVRFDPVSLDVADLDQDLIDRVGDGAFILEVLNPFGVGADFQITIAGPTIATIQKDATIGPESESTAVIPFTGSELRSFLGQPNVLLSGEAVVDAGAGAVTVNPGQELVLKASFDLAITIGGDFQLPSGN
ncbi:MAG: hypothetical protein OEN56_15635 [Gemmatimonadota bacterium]|nr:hypothetical protein [Gemmatimonadota bacterium]